MAEGPAPIELLRRLEEVCEDEPVDHIIFCCGIMVGQLLQYVAPPEDYENLIAGYMDAIRAAMSDPEPLH